MNSLKRGGVVWSARRAHNPEVSGSNPLPATISQTSRDTSKVENYPKNPSDFMSSAFRMEAPAAPRIALFPETKNRTPFSKVSSSRILPTTTDIPGTLPACLADLG